MKKMFSPRLMLVFSMVCFGTIGYFVRNIDLPSGEIALYRAFLAILLIGGYMLFTKQRINFKKAKKELLLLALSGGAMGINWILLFEAYKHTTVSVATLCYYFAPVLVTLACPLLFKEKMGAKKWVCFIMATLGLGLITGIGGMGEGDHLRGILFGISAAFFYATVVILNKYIKQISGIHRTFLQFVSAFGVLLPYVLLTDGINLSSLNGVGWASLVTVGLLHTGVTYCLYFSALKDLPGQTAAVLSYIDPLVAVIVSVTLLGETITPMQLVGGALILGFTLLNEIKFTPISR
ncbi:MAG: EamA family transporter [Clostridia bacterium]|nr:EamA family transporter [Clostridia bacterium]